MLINYQRGLTSHGRFGGDMIYRYPYIILQTQTSKTSLLSVDVETIRFPVLDTKVHARVHSRAVYDIKPMTVDPGAVLYCSDGGHLMTISDRQIVVDPAVMPTSPRLCTLSPTTWLQRNGAVITRFVNGVAVHAQHAHGEYAGQLDALGIDKVTLSPDGDAVASIYRLINRTYRNSVITGAPIDNSDNLLFVCDAATTVRQSLAKATQVLKPGRVRSIPFHGPSLARVAHVCPGWSENSRFLCLWVQFATPLRSVLFRFDRQTGSLSGQYIHEHRIPEFVLITNNGARAILVFTKFVLVYNLAEVVKPIKVRLPFAEGRTKAFLAPDEQRLFCLSGPGCCHEVFIGDGSPMQHGLLIAANGKGKDHKAAQAMAIDIYKEKVEPD